MWPWLVDTEAVRVPTGLALLATGATAGALLARLRASHSGLSVRATRDVALAGLFAALLGARAGDAWLTGTPIGGPLDLLAPRGGYALFAGLLAAVPAAWGVARLRGLDPWRTADLLAPALPLGLAFSRVGCLAAGCCYGEATSLPWAVPHPSDGGLVHPTPLYLAGLDLLVFSGLLAIERRAPPPGTLFLALLTLLGGGRALLDLTRPDLLLSYRLAAVAIALTGVTLLLWRRRACSPSSSS